MAPTISGSPVVPSLNVTPTTAAAAAAATIAPSAADLAALKATGKEAVAAAREENGTVRTTLNTATKVLESTGFEGAAKGLKEGTAAIQKTAGKVGVVTNGAALVLNASNAAEALAQGDGTKAAVSTVSAVGNGVDVWNGMKSLAGKKLNPVLEATSLAADAVAAAKTIADPNTTWAHKISAGIAVAAGVVSLTQPPFSPLKWVASAVQGAANVYSAHETRKELAAAAGGEAGKATATPPAASKAPEADLELVGP